MKTTFEKVSELNVAFGNERGNILDPNVKAIRKQAQLVLEEAIEMMEAAYPGTGIIWDWDQSRDAPEESVGVNMQLLLDAQGDVTTVNDGMAHVAGFDGNLVLARADASNLTKFIPDQASVQPALQYYYDLGFVPADLYISGEFPRACIKVTADVVVGGKTYPAGKFLKNMATFKEPDFSDILAGEAPDYNTITLNFEVDDDKQVNDGKGTLHIGYDSCEELIQRATVVALTDHIYQPESLNSDLAGQLAMAFPVVEFEGVSGLWVAKDVLINQDEIDQIGGDLGIIDISDATMFTRY